MCASYTLLKLVEDKASVAFHLPMHLILRCNSSKSEILQQKTKHNGNHTKFEFFKWGIKKICEKSCLFMGRVYTIILQWKISPSVKRLLQYSVGIIFEKLFSQFLESFCRKFCFSQKFGITRVSKLNYKKGSLNVKT